MRWGRSPPEVRGASRSTPVASSERYPLCFPPGQCENQTGHDTRSDGGRTGTPAKTIGIVVVTFRAAMAAGVLSVVMTSTFKSYEFLCELGKPVKLSFRPSIFERNVASTRSSAEFLQSLPDGINERLRGRTGLQDTQPIQFADRCLGTSIQWPGDSTAADKRDELASPHVSPRSGSSLPSNGTVCITAKLTDRRRRWVTFDQLDTRGRSCHVGWPRHRVSSIIC